MHAYISKDDQNEVKDPINFKCEAFRTIVFNDCPHVGLNNDNISTSHVLCTEMLDQLPDLNHKDVLVWFNPEFVILISNKYPDARITLVTGSLKAANLEWTKLKVDIVHCNPYNIDNVKQEINSELGNMKFDVIIGNPPYQSDNGGNSLWPQFVNNSLNLLNDDGHFSMVTPSRWILPGYNVHKGRVRIWEEFIKYNPIVFNIAECSKHFSVGQGDDYFSYVIIQKADYQNNTKLVLPDTVFDINLSENINWLPYGNINKTVVSIISKLSKSENKCKFVWKNIKHNKSDDKTSTYTHKLLKSPNNVVYTDTTSPLHYSKKVMFKLGRFITYKDRLMIDNIGEYSYTSVYIMELKDNENGDVFKRNIFKFLGKCLYNGSEITVAGYNVMPKVDLTRFWTDAELYAHFDLTQSEIDYIENTIK